MGNLLKYSFINSVHLNTRPLSDSPSSPLSTIEVSGSFPLKTFALSITHTPTVGLRPKDRLSRTRIVIGGV